MTFGHLLARAVARDVGRIMGFDETSLNEISKLIPHKLGITLEEAYQKPEFKAFVHRNHRNERWFEVRKVRRLTKTYVDTCCRYHYQ